MTYKRILVTGASGYIGRQLLAALKEHRERHGPDDLFILGTDIRKPEAGSAADQFIQMDIRDKAMQDLIAEYAIDSIIHLAAIVTPSRKMTREFIYQVEVEGTRNVMEGAVRNGVGKFVVTSSGAAYGYYPDNPDWLNESDVLRGNEEMPYPYHKRLVEEMLSEYRQEHPEVKQVVFRVCTILGNSVDNQITAMFHKKNVVGLKGTDTPFVFIWDQDLIACLLRAGLDASEGIYNVAGDGTVTLRQIAERLNKRFIALPPGLVKRALQLLNLLGATRYDPEEVKFIQYRPVLDNTRLKEVFGYSPRKTSKETFEYYLQSKGM